MKPIACDPYLIGIN